MISWDVQVVASDVAFQTPNDHNIQQARQQQKGQLASWRTASDTNTIKSLANVAIRSDVAVWSDASTTAIESGS
jgi:hypothetical protein